MKMEGEVTKLSKEKNKLGTLKLYHTHTAHESPFENMHSCKLLTIDFIYTIKKNNTRVHYYYYY